MIRKELYIEAKRTKNFQSSTVGMSFILEGETEEQIKIHVEANQIKLNELALIPLKNV